MRIRIHDVVRDVLKASVRPAQVVFSVVECEVDCGHVHGSSWFRLTLTRDVLYARNEQYGLKTRQGKHAMKSLQLMPDDVPTLECVVQWWKSIRQDFVDVRSYGSGQTGFQGSSVVFPQGTTIEYGKGEKLPECVLGLPLDDTFPSEGCYYISQYPFAQQYDVGRFSVVLEKNRVFLEDNITVQVFEAYQTDVLIRVLKFVAHDPSSALERLLGY